MKIAVPTKDNVDLEVKVEDRFGRAPYFAIIDGDSEEVKFVNNSAQKAASGAGVQAAQLMADEGVEVLLAGNIGPKAYSGLEKAGIEMYHVEQTVVEDAVANYKSGKLAELEGATNQGHVGLN